MDAGLPPICESAVREMDRALGQRACGAVISGHMMLGFRGIAGNESPFSLTCRTAVMPVMAMLGYGDAEYDLDSARGPSGSILAVVPMNRSMAEPVEQAASAMRTSGVGRGIATDGFLWVLMDSGPRGPKVRTVADLRPYYVETLDSRRFRTAPEYDTGYETEFERVFGRPVGS